MAVHGLSITKRVLFRGFQQEFSNVYHYYHSTELDGTEADSLIDAVKAIEVGLHSTDVTFVVGRCWSAGGSSAANAMISEKALSGTGTQATNASMDRERAVLAQWPAGVNTRGRPVYLRKWYHSCGGIAGVNFAAAAIHQNTQEIASADRTTIAAAVDAVEEVVVNAKNMQLVAKSGRLRTGPLAIYRWLEHHQLGDKWRG